MLAIGMFEGNGVRLDSALLGGVSLLALIALMPVHAYGADAAAPSRVGKQLEEIVVTSQKRRQNLQSVPISVTAISAATIKANRVTSVTDLAGLAPNVAIRPAPGGSEIPSFTIRGLISYGVVPGSDKETSIYLDGVYIGSPRGSTFELPDIDRIEVLRGPQGTLFGRNATTGAVSVVTRDPGGQLGAHQDFSVGNYGEFRSHTTINTPTWNGLSAYFSYVHDQRDGDIKNTGAGTVWDRTGPNTTVGVQSSPGTLGDKDANTYFVAIKFQPTDYFKTTYKFDREDNDFTPDGQAFLGYNPSSPLIGGLLQSLINSQPTPVLLDTSGKRPESVNNSFTTPGYQHNEGHTLTSDLRLADNLTVRNIAAYRENYISSASQLDGLGGLVFTSQAVLPSAILAAYSVAPPSVAPSLIPGYASYYGSQVGKRYVELGLDTVAQGRQWSDEIQSNYSNHWLTLTTGAIYYHSDDSSGGPPGIANNFNFQLLPTNGRIPLGSEATSDNSATSYAGYTQAELHVLPKLDLVGGVRVTHDDKSGKFTDGGTYIPGPGGSFTTGTFVGQVISPFTYSQTTPTFSVGANYKPAKDTLVFAKYSTGFVSGGAVGGVSFKRETVKSEELGAKAEFFQRRLRGSIALFNADYANVQAANGGNNVGHPELGTVIITQGSVHARGLEAEATARPIEGLTLNGSFGYTYTEFGAVNPIILAGTGGSAYPTLNPRWTAAVSAQYDTQPVYGDAYLSFRADGNYHTKELSEANPAYERIPGFGSASQIDPAFILNTRIALTNIPLGRTTAEIAVWSRNLTNDRGILFPLTFGTFSAASDFQPARTYGMDVSVNF